MLRVDKLPEVLRGVLEDGIEGVVLMTKEGSTLGAEFSNESGELSGLLAAISSRMWANYSEVSSEVSPAVGPSLQIVKLEQGILGICRVGEGYLLSAFGSDVTIGMMKLKMQGLSGYFTKVFEQVG